MKKKRKKYILYLAKKRKEYKLVMKINLLETSNDEIKTFYGKSEDGNKYIGAGGANALVLYKMSDDKKIIGVSLGFKKEDDTYRCDIENIINFLYYFGVCKELLEKFDREYSSLKMPICDATITEVNPEPSQDIIDLIDNCYKSNLHLYQDANSLNYMLKDFEYFKKEDSKTSEDKVYLYK